MPLTVRALVLPPTLLAIALSACTGDTGPSGQNGAQGVAGPTGPQGTAGPAGPMGATGPQGPAGTNGQDGVDGTPCWDLNANGTPDLATEDRNADGAVDALDCLGQDGQDGQDGQNGQDGVDGQDGEDGAPGQACWDLDDDGNAEPATEDRNGDGAVNVQDCHGLDGAAGPSGLHCWDLNGNGAQDPTTEDLDGNGTVDARDCAGLSTGNLIVEVIDARTAATLGPAGLMVGARVELDADTSLSVDVDDSGRASFSRLPVGIYWLTASAPGLEVSGSTVEQVGSWSASEPLVVSVVAASNRLVRVQVDRGPMVAQLATLHDPASGAAYTNDNCKACHGNRENERSLDPAIWRWHSKRGPGDTYAHTQLGCTTCHVSRLDLTEESGPFLRKSVGIATCQMCHPNYPTVP